MSDRHPPGNPPGDNADAELNVLAKLDRLLAKHRPFPAGADLAEIPVLDDSPRSESPAPDDVPLLTDIVAGPGRVSPNARIDEVRIILRRLLQLLQAERARWLSESGDDPQQARIVEAVISAIETELPTALAEAASAMPEIRGPADGGRL